MDSKTKKIIIIVAAVLAVIVVFFGLIGTINTTDNEKETQPPILSDEDQIKARIETFLTAYNTGDMDTVLECLDAKTRNAFEAWLNILGAVAGKYTGIDIDLSDLFSLGVNTTKGDFMGLTINSINITDTKNAVVTTTMTLSGQTMTIYFKMLRENGGWYINDMTDKNIDNSKPSTGEGYSMYWGLDYVDGVAIAYYYENNILCKCILNPNGEVIYRTKDGSDLIAIGGSSVIVLGYNEKTTRCDIPKYIVNSNGEVVEVDGVAKEMKFIVGGDGMALLYEYKEDAHGVQHLYGVLNSSGEFSQPIMDLGKSPLIDTWNVEHSYLGDGVFAIVTNSNYDESANFIIFNSNNCNKYYISYVKSNLLAYHNGFVFSHVADWTSWIICPYDPSNKDDRGVLAPTCYLLDVNNSTYQEYDSENKKIGGFSNGYVWYRVSGEKNNIYVENVFTNESFTFDEYEADKTRFVKFTADYGVALIKGTGDRSYVTLVDKSGNQKFEPFEIYHDGFSGKYTLTYSEEIFTFENLDRKWCIADKNGNIIQTDYAYIGEFSNGRASACIGESQYDSDAVWVYIDKTGEPVMDTIPKQ